MRTTSLCRAVRLRWMAMWRKATTASWTMVKVAMVSSTRMALLLASTQWRRTRMRQRAMRAPRPLHLSMPSTHWHSLPTAHGGLSAPNIHLVILGFYNSTRHPTPTHRHTHKHITIWNTSNTEEMQQGLSGDCVDFPLMVTTRNSGLQLDHKPLLYVSRPKIWPVWGDVLTKWTVLVLLCALFALYPHRLEVCLLGSFQYLEASTSVIYRFFLCLFLLWTFSVSLLSFLMRPSYFSVASQ